MYPFFASSLTKVHFFNILHIITHNYNKKNKQKHYFCLSYVYYKVEFISSIYCNTSSRPNPVSDDVINTGGNSSQSSSRRFLYDAILLASAVRVILSAFVNTIENGMPFSPSHSMNSRSIFCGSCLQSISTKSNVIASRSRI